MADSIALVWDLIARDNASGTFRKVGAEAEGASGAVGKLVGGFTALAVGGAIAASVKAAADFQASMLLVQTQAGASRAEVEKMTPAILSLAGQVAQAPEALATSLYHVESTGLRGSQALDAVRVAAEGAKVGHADLEQTTNALTATIASGMLPATETYKQAMGQLNTIVGSGDMKMQDLNEALSTGLLVTMKQYGVTVPDVGAALADFGDNNIRGADAATKLRMAVQALESPAKTGAAALKTIGITQKELADDMATGGLNKALTDLHDHLLHSGVDASQWGQLLTDAFTKKAGSGVLTLIGTFDRFQQKYQEVSKGANSFGDAWTATTKTASFQFSALKDSVDALGIRIGTALLPYVTDLAKHVTDFVNSSGFHDFLTTAGHDAVVAGDAVRGLAGWVAGLPGPVREFGTALLGLRIADHIGLLDKLGAGAGNVSTAFAKMRQEAELQRALYGMQASGLSDMERALGGLGTKTEEAGTALGRFGATAGSISKTAFSGIKSAASGLMDMFGGPWAIALAGAGTAVAGLVDWLSKDHDIVPKVKVDTDGLTAAIQGNSGAIDDNVRRQAALALQQAGLFKAANQWGVSLKTLTDASLGNSDAMKQVAAAAQTYKDKQDAAAKSTAVQNDQTGLAADAYKKAGMQSDTWLSAIQKLAGTTASQVADAKQITDAVKGSTTAVAGAVAMSDSLKAATTTAGATIKQVWAANTVVLGNATDAQIKDMQSLGYTVTHLPNGSVVVNADTGPAKAQMQALVDSYKNYSININPQGMALTTQQRNLLYSGKATGGPITGPGSGTSDTAGLFALSNGEHVWTAAEVAAAGGHGAVEALRSTVLAQGRGLAAGGPVVTEPARFSDAYMNTALAMIRKMGQMAQANAFTSVGGNPANRSMGQAIANVMGYGGQFSAIDYVFSHESGWNNNAQNPTSTAYGIPQFLNSTWAQYGGKTSDPATQIVDGIKYMRDRYGSPNGAASFWQQHHWYDNGGWLQPGATLALNGTGKPERIRTAEQESALQQQLSGAPLQITGTLDLGDGVKGVVRGEIAGALGSVRNALTY